MLSAARRSGPALRSLNVRCSSISARCSSSAAGTKKYEPLRVLFCGADDFSIYSLRALHELHKQRPDKIESIDVVCRPDKRVGRGLKQVREVPIKGVATELGLNLHQLDTFRGWVPPAPFSLIVAVSFGLLVPARIIEGAKYGGLNVHPSLLPEFRGPAPIQHTLLQHRTYSGVTLQTMHPAKFDHGMVLDQTRTDLAPNNQHQNLVELLGPIGAEMLAKDVDEGVFVPPLKEVDDVARGLQASYAPKITPEDHHIDWETWSAADIITRDKVLGRLWDTTTYDKCMHGKTNIDAKRVTFHGPWLVYGYVQFTYHCDAVNGDLQVGDPVLQKLSPVVQNKFFGISSGSMVGFRTVDDHIVVPAEMTIEGGRRLGGRPMLTHALHKTVNKRHLQYR